MGIQTITKLQDKFHVVICGDGPQRTELEKLTVRCFNESRPASRTATPDDTQNEASLVNLRKQSQVFRNNMLAAAASGSHVSTASVPVSSSNINVTFAGAIDNSLLPDFFYRGADLFLTCSES